MKLANLFLITALVGVLGAIGCTTDSGNGNGNGGTGGDGADIGCDEGDCLTDTELQQQCEDLAQHWRIGCARNVAVEPLLQRAVDEAADIIPVLLDRGLNEATKDLHTRTYPH